MTYLGKRKDSDKRESAKVENNAVNAVNLIKKDDILKQSIKTAGFEDTSLFFVQSGLVSMSISYRQRETIVVLLTIKYSIFSLIL